MPRKLIEVRVAIAVEVPTREVATVVGGVPGSGMGLDFGSDTGDRGCTVAHDDRGMFSRWFLKLSDTGLNNGGSGV